MYIKNLFLSIRGQKTKSRTGVGYCFKQEREEEGERGTNILYIAADSGGQGSEVVGSGLGGVSS
jgi:hypothetical protein